MRENRGLIKAVIVMVFALVCSLLPDSSCYAASDIPVVQAPDKVQSIRRSDTSIQIRWESIPDVDGYIIYRYHASSKNYKEIHTIKSSSIKKGMIWTDKHLRTNKVYKYKMASYKIIDGKTQVSDRSDWVSAKTYKRNSKKINARAPKVSKKEVYLGLCTAKKVTAYSKPAKYGKNKKKKVISNQIRWNSSDPAVATVDKKGVITAGVKAGTCSVYAKAHNGTRTKIKVIVKAAPKTLPLEDQVIFRIFKLTIQRDQRLADIHGIIHHGSKGCDQGIKLRGLSLERRGPQ